MIDYLINAISNQNKIEKILHRCQQKIIFDINHVKNKYLFDKKQKCNLFTFITYYNQVLYKFIY